MKISDLLNYREQILGSQPLINVTQIQNSIKALEHSIAGDAAQNIKQTELNQSLTEFTAGVDHCVRGLQHVADIIQHLTRHVDRLIQQQHDPYLSRSRRLWQDQFSQWDQNAYLDRTLVMDSHQKFLLENKLQRHSGWQDVGLILRPGRGDIVESMAAMGTLYIFDWTASMIVDAMCRFPEQYRDRFRGYHGHGTASLDQLPGQQMRLIFVHNFFNYMHLDLIREYLMKLLTLLRPGGTVICTFNDCDYAVNALMAERNYQCYTPGHLLQQQAESLGLVVTDRQWFTNGLAWMELQLPGKYRSLKSAPISTKIHARSK